MSDGSQIIHEGETLQKAFDGIDAHNIFAESQGLPRIVGCEVPKSVIGKD